MNSLAVAEAPEAEVEPKFSAFTGAGRRLDGKSSKHQPQPISSTARSSDDNKQAGAASSRYGHSQQSTGSSSVNGTRQSQGKLVFGQNVNRNPKETPKVTRFAHIIIIFISIVIAFATSGSRPLV